MDNRENLHFYLCILGSECKLLLWLHPLAPFHLLRCVRYSHELEHEVQNLQVPSKRSVLVDGVHILVSRVVSRDPTKDVFAQVPVFLSQAFSNVTV